MVWIPAGAWIGAAVVAVVVLGFCAYEIIWKTRRLQRDVAQLQQASTALTDLAARLAATGERLTASRERLTAPGGR